VRDALRVIVYYPSFAHWGGAERLALQAAAALAADHEVVLCAEHVPPRHVISSYFGVDLDGVGVDPLRAGGPIAARLIGNRWALVAGSTPSCAGRTGASSLPGERTSL
jgi:hypothetical protein